MGKHHTKQRFTVVVAASALVCVLGMSACGNQASEARRRIVPEYDQKTGKLRLLKYDANGNGQIDTWSYMEGARVIRIEIDDNEDGKLDRWEYYGADQKLEKVGFSRASDGKEDAWSFSAPDGSVARIEISTLRDGKVNRIEHYQQGRLVSAEEDGDGDGAIDKWETYDGDRLASVAFDTVHRGTPDRRLLYAADGTVRIEVDEGDGVFVAARAAKPASRIPTNPKSRIPNPE
jgi:hypothetical protein